MNLNLQVFDVNIRRSIELTRTTMRGLTNAALAAEAAPAVAASHTKDALHTARAALGFADDSVERAAAHIQDRQLLQRLGTPEELQRWELVSHGLGSRDIIAAQAAQRLERVTATLASSDPLTAQQFSSSHGELKAALERLSQARVPGVGLS